MQEAFNLVLSLRDSNLEPTKVKGRLSTKFQAVFTAG
jgi:hypothetical protein